MNKILCGMLLFAFSGCVSIDNKPLESEIPGRYYRIKEGDTLDIVARKYRISIAEIMDINGIDNPRALRVGQAIFLPDPDPIGSTIAKLVRKTPTPAVKVNPEKTGKTLKAPVQSAAKGIMEFPIPGGHVFQEFSRNKKNPYDGIGIKAQQGEKVQAALDGKVLFVGDDGTKFGLIVIIEHQAPYITVYTHLDKALVSIGQHIKQRAPIGLVGRSGGVDMPHLHFQVRVKERPQNPRLFFKS